MESFCFAMSMTLEIDINFYRLCSNSVQFNEIFANRLISFYFIIWSPENSFNWCVRILSWEIINTAAINGENLLHAWPEHAAILPIFASVWGHHLQQTACFRESTLRWTVALTSACIMLQMPLSRGFSSGKYSSQTTFDQYGAILVTKNSSGRSHSAGAHP